MSTLPEVVLSTEALQAGYGKVPVLHGIDVKVHEDEIVGILGHNGMGKSTLIKTLMGLVPVQSGSVHIMFDHNHRHGFIELANQGAHALGLIMGEATGRFIKHSNQGSVDTATPISTIWRTP